MTERNLHSDYHHQLIGRILRWIGLIVLFSHLPAFSSEVNHLNKTLRIGLLPDSAQTIMISRFGPLMHYIERETGLEIKHVQSKDYQELLNQFKEKKIDLAFFGGYTFVMAQKKARAEPLVMRDIDLHFNTVFLVRPEDANKQLEDFKDTVMAFGSRQSTSGHLMPRYFLSERKIHPESFFAKVLYSGSHDKTAYWVRDGKTDLGAANSEVIRKMFKEGHLKHTDIQILWQTPAYTDYVWAIQPDFDSSLRIRLQDVFLSLSPLNPEHAFILESLGAKGFLPAHNADFDLLRKVVTLLELETK